MGNDETFIAELEAILVKRLIDEGHLQEEDRNDRQAVAAAIESWMVGAHFLREKEN
jgi:hypothetical protein